MGRFPLVDKALVSEEKNKPVLDEQTLAKLLEAAYVLQEHNHELQEIELGLERQRAQIEAKSSNAASAPTPAPEPEPTVPADYTFTLAKIVETQHQIQVRHLELESAMSLVAERLVQIARASGAAVGILDGKKVRYRAVSGALTLPAGTEVPTDKSLCLPCIRTSQVFRCADINPEFLIDPDECRRRGIGSLIAVPIFHDGGVAGSLELYYPRAHAFTEQDVHTCQLMAGLVTEALARNEELTWKESLATERAVMMEALEKLKPNLAALMETSGANDSAPKPSVPAAPASTFNCRKCGHTLVGEEQFCGNCGTPRNSEYQAPSMQSKVASLWHMQEAMKKTSPAEAAEASLPLPTPRPDLDRGHSEKSLADSLEEEMPELFEPVKGTSETTSKPEDFEGPISAEFEDSILTDLESPPSPREQDDLEPSPSTALVKQEPAANWSSAVNAREFLEQLAPSQRPGSIAHFWATRRGDIYLAIAVLLVGVVIRWGIWSSQPVGATDSTATAAGTHRKPAPGADLSLFERMLISLGLAEAPPVPEYKGNPDTQVWVDLHTALYYCPGADLYGKTPKGKFTSQRDAQLDQFEPANRKNCE